MRRVCLLVLLLPAVAAAQRGPDVTLFAPALDGYGLFTVERAETAPRWGVGAQLYASYAQTPLQLGICPLPCPALAKGQRPPLRPVLTRQVTLDLGAHFGLTSWLEWVLDLPVAAQGYGKSFGRPASRGDSSLTGSGFYLARHTNVPPPDAAPRDWRVGLKARLWQSRYGGVALLAVATLPFGDESAFLGESSFTFRPLLIGEIGRGRLTVVLNLGARLRRYTVVYAPDDPPGTPRRALLELGDELTAALGLSWRLSRRADVAAELFGQLPLDRRAAGVLDAPRDITAEVLGGIHLFATPALVLALGCGVGLIADAVRHDTFRAFAAVRWTPVQAPTTERCQVGTSGCPAADRDGDNISDSVDRCPVAPEDEDGFHDDDGCPDLDNDGDGLPDRVDECPNEREDGDHFADGDGCPDRDNDEDGVPDGVDRCPDDRETPNRFEDGDGCPDAAPLRPPVSRRAGPHSRPAGWSSRPLGAGPRSLMEHP